MDPAQFAGMSWDVWAAHVEKEDKEQLNKLTSNVNKLKKEDLKIFGRIVDSEPLNLHLCEMCGMVIKAQALLHHYMNKHDDRSDQSSCKRASPEVGKTEDSHDHSPSSDMLQAGLCVKENECSSFALGKNTSTSPVSAVHRHPKGLAKTRSPLGPMCLNGWSNKKKDLRGRKATKGRNLNLPSRKAAFSKCGKLDKNVETKMIDESVEYISHQLPGMSLNSGEEEKTCGEDAATNDSSLTESVTFKTSPPKALSSTPLFSCHRAGGLMYPGRHMKTTRNTLKKMLDEDRFSGELLLEIRKRRKNTVGRKKKSNINKEKLTTK